ncbi:MAG: hypothetical protein ACK53R_11510 [Bacteroidota bacterium]|jgi:hypothetical protein
MKPRVTLKTQVRTQNRLKTTLTYSALGVFAGSLACAVIIMLSEQLKSTQSLAKSESVELRDSKSICAGDTIMLNAVGGDLYVWSPERDLKNAHSGNPIAKPKKTTIYTASIYKKLESIFSEIGRYQITAELLNSKERILYRKEVPVAPKRDYVFSFNARTLSALDKGMLEIIINRKLAGKFFISSRYPKTFEYLWTNTKSHTATITLLLTHYDGDGDIIEIPEMNIRSLEKQSLTTTVQVKEDCP